MAEKASDGEAALVAPDGTRTPLTDDMYEALSNYARTLARKRNRAAIAVDYVSTGEAASMLGVSRQTLNRMLEAGEIPFERYGKGHRRVLRSDVLAYREASRSGGRAAPEGAHVAGI